MENTTVRAPKSGTPEAFEQQTKIIDYINKKNAEKGLPPSQLKPHYSDEVMERQIKLAVDALREVSYAMKKRYSADFKEYTKKLDEITTNFTTKKYNNGVIEQMIIAFLGELREHPAHQEFSQDKADRDAKLQSFAEHHSIAIYGGKTCIRRHEEKDWMLPDQLRSYYAHVEVPTLDNKSENIVTAFMQWEGTKRYRKVIFDPSHDGHYDGLFNVWEGWTVEPEEGDDDALWWEILAAACGYNDEYIDFVSKWFADIVQRPARNPGVAIGIQGMQGVGKSALIETIGALISNTHGKDRDHVISGAYGDFTMDELLADYNEHVAHKLLVYLDEATWGGSHADAQRMKKVITKNEETINPKFLGRITVPCYRRIVFSSNDEFYYRADKDDRRLLPLEFDTSKINDKSFDFWKSFYEARSNGKMLSNLLHHLQQIDLTGWEPQQALKSLNIVTGKSIIENSKEAWEHWLDEVVDLGVITIEAHDELQGRHEEAHGIENTSVSDKLLEDAYLLWAKKHRCNVSWFSDSFKKARTVAFGERVKKQGQWVRITDSCEDMHKRLTSKNRWKPK